MSRKEKTAKRRLSAGTVFMLSFLAVVLCASAVVLSRLSSGASVDLSKLNMNVLALQTEAPEAAETLNLKGQSGNQPAAEHIAVTAPPSAAPSDVEEKRESCTLTAGGSISLSGEVRKNCWNADAKVNDYSDVMMLLASRIRGDINCVFLENIVSDLQKASDTVAPASAAVLLKEAGFGTAACGFSQAYAGGRSGVEATLSNLSAEGITPVGIRYGDERDPSVLNVTGKIRTAVLQYTATIPAKTRKSMAKDGTDDMIPEADLTRISMDITNARDQGAEAVIVMMNWGKTGKDPDQAQRELAEGIALAGADLIIGNGSRVPQTAEYLTGRNGKNILCVWSLGSLLTGDRSNTKRLSGYLLHVVIRKDGQGGVDVIDPEYTPVYTWKYKQDSRYYYRCIAADAEAPDGMDSEQRKTMNRVADYVNDLLNGSPLKRRGQGNGD